MSMRSIHRYGRYFENKDGLLEAVLCFWSQIEKFYISSLYQEVPIRLIELVKKNGGPTVYELF